jgi:hypothetical protein
VGGEERDGGRGGLRDREGRGAGSQEPGACSVETSLTRQKFKDKMLRAENSVPVPFGALEPGVTDWLCAPESSMVGDFCSKGRYYYCFSILQKRKLRYRVEKWTS